VVGVCGGCGVLLWRGVVGSEMLSSACMPLKIQCTAILLDRMNLKTQAPQSAPLHDLFALQFL